MYFRREEEGGGKRFRKKIKEMRERGCVMEPKVLARLNQVQ